MIRKGFVSNSSSSSFVISYNRNAVVRGAKDIVEFLKSYPNEQVIFDGGDWREGSAVFIMDDNVKSLIRKYSEEFISHPRAREIEYALYTGDLSHNEDYMRDNTLYFSQFNEYRTVGNSGTVKHLYELSSDDYYKAVEDYLDSLDGMTEDRDSKLVWIDYELHDGDSMDLVDFYDSFISTEDEGERLFAIQSSLDDWGEFSGAPAVPYALMYKTRIDSKEDIVEYLKYTHTGDNLGICYLNESYEYVTGGFVGLEMYALGQREIEYLIEHEEEFLGSTLNVSLFIDYRFHNKLVNINNVDVGKSLLLRTGKFKEIVDCFEDFANTFFKR